MKVLHTLFLWSLLIVANCHRIHAQIQTGPAPTWKNLLEKNYPVPNAKKIQGGFYEVLYENQEHVELQEDYFHIIRKVETHEGVQYGSQITISFNPSYQKLILHNIVVKREGIAINKLDVRKFRIESEEQEESKFVYNGTKVATLVLDDIRKGDEIDYDYSIKGRNPVLNGQYFSTLYTNVSSPIGLLYYALIFSEKRNLHFKESYRPPTAQKRKSNGLVVYEWKQELPNQYEFEEYTPAWYFEYPNIQISEMSSWAEIVNWALPMYKVDGNLKDESLLKMANKWKAETNGDKRKYAHIATRFVQDEIRYMGIEVGVNSHQPNKPDNVFKQRFGDCKDKALLLCNLLKFNDIEAYPVLVNTYKKGYLDNFLPSPFGFNHVITYFEIEQRPYWIDATIAHQKGPLYKNALPLYGKGLKIKLGEQDLCGISEGTQGKTKIRELYVLPEIGGDASLSVLSTYTQEYADEMRTLFENSAFSEIEKSYNDFYAALFPGKSVFFSDSLLLSDDTADNIVRTTEYYTIKNIWGKTDSLSRKSGLDLFGKVLYDRLIMLKNSSSVRKTPLAIQYPCDIDYELNIEFPSTWKVTEDSVSFFRSSYMFTYSAKYDDQNHSLQLRFYYKSYKDHVPISELVQYDADMKKIEELLGLSLSYGGTSTASNQEDRIHIGALLWALLLVVGSTIAANKYYKTSLNTLYNGESLPIGSWLLILAISLSIVPFYFLYTIIDDGYFHTIFWYNIRTNGISILYPIFSITANVVIFCFSILLLVLFFKRRDTFPKTFIAFLVINFLILVVDYLWLISYTEKNFDTSKTVKSLLQALIRSAVWIPVMIYSSRIKQTFTQRYATAVSWVKFSKEEFEIDDEKKL